AGIASFFSLGQLEDPEFTVKTAVIATAYPGASPKEVELEVTDRIEQAIQEMSQVDHVESISRADLSLISVDIKSEFWIDRLPQVWDELRRKINDVQPSLPPGALTPEVSDDFGDVFGFQLAVTGDGFSYAELEKYAKNLRKELSLVKGVARVDLWGVQDKAVYLDTSQVQLAELGITDESISNTLNKQNMVVDAGSVDVQSVRMRIAPTGTFGTPQDIADLSLRPSMQDTLGNLMSGGDISDTTDLIRIKDIAKVRTGYIDPPVWLMRYNGEPALDVSITTVSGANIVAIGEAIDVRLEQLILQLPVGIEVHRYHWQSNIVDEAVQNFLISFLEAVAIVLVVLTLAMGWRMGVIIGIALIVTILISFILMSVFGIDLQRMSLGALIIALGMMVDNAIVVADGISVRFQQGMERSKAAIEAASQPAMPLLGATVVAVMAFYPIFASTSDSGEYCRTLFTVVAISLMVSWVVSMTLTPLQCMLMLPEATPGEQQSEPYSGRFYDLFRSVLTGSIRFRWLTMAIMIALLITSVIGFGRVTQLFFPDSSMTKFMVDYWAPEGTRIQQVETDLRKAEQHLLNDDRVEGVSTFIGQGPPRFYLPVDPESPYASYAQLIVNVHEFNKIDSLIADLTGWFDAEYSQAQVSMRKYGVGPSNTWKFEVRFSGPAEADPALLRDLGNQGISILRKSPLSGVARTDWRQRTQKVVPEYNQERGRWAAITRDDIANSTKRAFDGFQVGLYREGDDLLPIILRHVEEERLNVGGWDTLQIQAAGSTDTLPLLQVINGVDTQWEDPFLGRRDRRRTITVQSNPALGVTLPTLRERVLAEFEAIKLPPGYTMEWGGEYEDTVEGQAALIPGVIPTLAVILLIIVALFNAIRPPLVIVLTIPFVMIGITFGLLVTNTPFGFVALLGAMSLAGMMIKNSIVLLDQVNLDLAAGKSPYQAVIDSAVSRLRPVALAAATTVLGVIPLIQDVFWVGLAVSIMAGLTFGTILTMILVPVQYAILHKIKV
ncbi:MAG: efflux RND transporter permease subunit, partial [Methylococcales bacterium]|nr:efflux RND transporter permease subunit [Methylococcales bacterium]